MSGVAIATSKSVQPPLHSLGEVLAADRVGAGRLRLARLVALGEDGDRDVPAEAVRQHHRAAHLLVGVADVDPEADVDLDGLGELGATASTSRSTPPRAGGYSRHAVDPLAKLPVALAVLSSLTPTTSTPIERAVPSMIFIAWSTSLAFRSGILVSAIWRTWARLIVPTFSRFGSPEPFSIPIACLISTAAGGVLVMKVNERSS